MYAPLPLVIELGGCPGGHSPCTRHSRQLAAIVIVRVHIRVEGAVVNKSSDDAVVVVSSKAIVEGGSAQVGCVVCALCCVVLGGGEGWRCLCGVIMHAGAVDLEHQLVAQQIDSAERRASPPPNTPCTLLASAPLPSLTPGACVHVVGWTLKLPEC